jgi:hypothetical protein
MENDITATENGVMAAIAEEHAIVGNGENANGVMAVVVEENEIVANGENATENADFFYTASEFMERIAEREENSTDYAIQNNEQETEEEVDVFNSGENAATDAIIMQFPQTKIGGNSRLVPLFRRAGRYY